MSSPRLRLLSYMVPGFPHALFERIAATLDAELLIDSSRSGPGPDEDPFRDGTADLGWICSTSYVDLAMRGSDPSVQLVGVAWVPEDPASAGEPRYFGDLVVRADSAVTDLADLAGKTIGCNDEVSLSGHHSLRIALRERKFDADTFADLRFTGGHHQSLDDLTAGRLDAAVVDSVVRINRSETDNAVGALRVVERLGPWPVQPLVARADLSPDVVAALRDVLLASNDDPHMMTNLRAASLSRFVQVPPSHYLPIRSALAASGAF